jgi:hypothetical protein
MRTVVARTILLSGTLLALWNVHWAWAIYEYCVFLAQAMPITSDMDPFERWNIGLGWMLLTIALVISALFFATAIFGFIWEALGTSEPQPFVDMTVD